MKKDKEEKKKNTNCTCEECECEDCKCGECTCENCECENCKCDECNCEDCEPSEDIEKLGNQILELTDKLQRTQAEMINFKRRKEEETSNRLKYCNKDILLELVKIVDNFERAFKMDDANLEDEVSKFLSGFKMIYSSTLELLRTNEVKEIECLGKEFDPNTMEALLVEHFEEKAHNEVIDVLQKGYMYKDIILRPAMVKIND